MDNSPQRAATIEDVARLAGVSIATVSRTISKPEKVAESTRKKVTVAIARTGYTVNALARNLRMQRSKMVMVLAASIADPNFAGILIGLEKLANSRGYGVLIGNTENNVALEENYLRFISSGMADGLILLTGHLPVAGWPKRPEAFFPPMVAATHPVNNPNVSYVGVDDVGAAVSATEYLVSLGHKEITFVSGPTGAKVSENRQTGFHRAITSSHLITNHQVVVGDGTSEGGRAAVERLFIQDNLPTAFFCYNDDTAIGVISALRSRGYRVPEDFSVIGFDDIPFANRITPALTTIRQPRKKIGALAMGLLLDILTDRSLPPEQIFLHGDLVVRDSCGRPREHELGSSGA
ncbi:MAG: LacI family DNA-binding transcriptional regulator [Paracoccaceae bacterium]